MNRVNEMRWLFIIIISVCLVGSNLNAYAQANRNSKDQIIAEGIIRDIITKIKSSSEGHHLLSDVDPNTITFSFNKRFPNSKGWIVRWHLEKGTSIVSNPNMPAKSTAVIVVTDDDGILLELFFSSDQGDIMEDSTEIFHVSEKPRMDIGYWLITKGENQPLKERIHQIITDEIALIPKAP